METIGLCTVLRHVTLFRPVRLFLAYYRSFGPIISLQPYKTIDRVEVLKLLGAHLILTDRFIMNFPLRQ